jgi:peptidoglycan/LPS O-acetylase OafA/YrhL
MMATNAPYDNSLKSLDIGQRRFFGLDLIRATAIGSVVYVHSAAMLTLTGHDFLPSWLDGVELFFVLSGFLIGGLLIEIAERGPTARAWMIFMIRRWMRTLPVYFAVGIVLLALSSQVHEKLHHAMLYGTLTQNLAWPMPEDNWLGVSWSLTIEEWFYLLFSAIFLLSARMLGRPGQWLALSVFLVLPLAARLAIPVQLDFDLYVRKIVVLRLDAIAYGVVLARLYADQSRLFRAWKLALIAGVSILAAVYTWPLPFSPIVTRSIILNVTLIGWALCFPAALRLTKPHGFLGRCIVAVSRQSYAIYLVHLFLLTYCERATANGQLPWQLLVPIALSATWIVSYLSLCFFESPILAWRPRQWRPRQVDSTPRHPSTAVGSPLGSEPN